MKNSKIQCTYGQQVERAKSNLIIKETDGTALILGNKAEIKAQAMAEQGA